MTLEEKLQVALNVANQQLSNAMQSLQLALADCEEWKRRALAAEEELANKELAKKQLEGPKKRSQRKSNG